MSEPDRMIGFSLIADPGVASPIQQARQRMHVIRQGLKRKNRQLGEYAWTVEANPKGTGYHAHMLQRGDYIPQSLLQSVAQSAGAGIPHIARIKGGSLTAAGYGLKGFAVAGYGLKGFTSPEPARAALELNGGRLDHHSRGFYRVGGVSVPVKAAERNAQQVLHGHRSQDFFFGEWGRAYALSVGIKSGAPPVRALSNGELFAAFWGRD